MCYKCKSFDQYFLECYNVFVKTYSVYINLDTFSYYKMNNLSIFC